MALIAAGLGSAAFADPALSQQAIATVDQEQLFVESAFGQRVLSEIDTAGEALAAENRRIEAELTSEEMSLTEERAEVDRAAFADLARAFDQKVTRIRSEQDAKARALARLRDDGQQEFFRRAAPILNEVLAESGAAVLLDRRVVLSARAETDITERAIARIDAALGDGSDADDRAGGSASETQAPD